MCFATKEELIRIGREVYIGQDDLTALFGEDLYVQLDADGAQAGHDPGLISYLCLPASA